MTTRLAKLTKARIASTSYRLSPQNTFPAPVLDVLIAYVSLLHPPPGAPYRAVPANKIVFAGNSAGGTLLFALIKFLIELSRLKQPQAPKIRFHGKEIGSIPLPAGLATVSGWCDPCDALPSWHTNGEYDFLGVLQPACIPGHPTDAIWPASPPREHPYCRAVTLDHDLVCAAAVQDWAGAPPTWFAVGCEEQGLDGNKVTASQMAKSGVSVEWNEYEGMTHEFVIMTSKLPQAKLAFEQWAAACQNFVNGKCKNGATHWLMPDARPVDIGPPTGLSPLPHAVIREKMREYNATRPIWTGKLHETNMTKL